MNSSLHFPNAGSYWLSLLQVWMLKSRFWSFRLPCFWVLEVLKMLCDASVFEFPASPEWNLGALLILCMLLWLPPHRSRKSCMAKFRFVFTGKNKHWIRGFFIYLLAAWLHFLSYTSSILRISSLIWFRYFNLVHNIFVVTVQISVVSCVNISLIIGCRVIGQSQLYDYNTWRIKYTKNGETEFMKPWMGEENAIIPWFFCCGCIYFAQVHVRTLLLLLFQLIYEGSHF